MQFPFWHVLTYYFELCDSMGDRACLKLIVDNTVKINTYSNKIRNYELV